MSKKELNFRFHDPNPAGVAADFLLKLLADANQGRLEAAIRDISNEDKQQEEPGFSLSMG